MFSTHVETFIHTFYGYGNPAGPFWFIGMEEGGGESQEEVVRRIDVWQELGCPETADVAEFHHRTGMDYFFKDPVALQHTWAQIIRLILTMKGEDTDIRTVKEYQKSYFARKKGETCSLELLPLPAPSTSVWLYSVWTDIPYLRSRGLYRRNCRQWRAAHLREMVCKHHPAVVVFYGFSYRKWYEMISGSPLLTQEPGDWAMAKSDKIIFALTKHPAARGVSNDYFERVGSLIGGYRE